MEDLTEAYLSIYNDINEVKGFGGRVDPKTGKFAGEVSSPSQKVFQQYHNDVQHLGREAGSKARSRSVTHGEPRESGVVRSNARGVDVTKQDPGLAMTPAKRMETRATALRARGQNKRANKIDAVRNRPNMEEGRAFPGGPNLTHTFPLKPEEQATLNRIRAEIKAQAAEKANKSTTKSASKPPTVEPEQNRPRTRTTNLDKVRIGESHDFYDLVLTHLLDEGYCDSQDSAIKMMAAMSQDWIDAIVEEFVDPEHGETPSGRTPLENVADHPKKSVRKKAIKAFKDQMGKEYGGNWKSKSNDAR